MSTEALATATLPNDLEAYWMPFTPNRQFEKAPRLMTRAKDMHCDKVLVEAISMKSRLYTI